jgi:hypothetical protein
MTCNLRYLTSDGRVLRCTVPGDHDDDEMLIELNGQHNSNTRGRSWMNYDGVTWPANDPCAWDATCTDCKGRKQVFAELDVPEEDGMGAVTTRPCRPCEGTGVDETIPLHLIGPGSVLQHCDNPEERFRVVVVELAGEYGELGTLTAVWLGILDAVYIVLDDIGPNKTWQVARVVPPAHTPND